MKILLQATFLLFSLMFLIYLSFPSPSFPLPPEDALVSMEPADLETSLRRGYFTDLSREEVLRHYQAELSKARPVGLPLPNYRLNYPPEEAQTLIRDQTRSTFLEEIVHPFRESLFVNGFEPKLDKDTIRVEGKLWRQKITLRYVPSNVGVRVSLGIVSLLFIYLLTKDLYNALKDLGKVVT
jgi:hypothetical protein